MLDRKFIRENPDVVGKAIVNKHEKADLSLFLELDLQERDLKKQADDLRAERNRLSEKVSELKKQKQDASAEIESVRTINTGIKSVEEKYETIHQQSESLLNWFPNIPHHTTPIGESEEDNVEIRQWGQPRIFDFPVKAHYEIGEQQDIMDFQRAGKISGARFSLLKGRGARLERALIDFMLDIHTLEHGYTEIAPPYLVNYESMFATGQLPKLEDEMFNTGRDPYFLIPTAEVPVTNLHRDEILKEDQLPLYYASYTACFRREAGTYGKDTRGLIRVHQFDKVEMVKFVKPENSYEELELLVKNAEKLLQLLNLPYRVIQLCTADLSFASAKCYDLEVWLPSQGKYREISSCSNFEDFQARRGKIRFRRNSTRETEFVHTLNGSGLAVGRTMAAILENYQTPDGNFTLPDVLTPYIK
ncbi:MAG: serine--tRNA ligase [Candidatus Delongbacteria bacterium]|nr:serine--tRNA ligase [Candidatus Delongbacteria bacterium]